MVPYVVWAIDSSKTSNSSWTLAVSSFLNPFPSFLKIRNNPKSPKILKINHPKSNSPFPSILMSAAGLLGPNLVHQMHWIEFRMPSVFFVARQPHLTTRSARWAAHHPRTDTAALQDCSAEISCRMTFSTSHSSARFWRFWVFELRPSETRARRLNNLASWCGAAAVAACSTNCWVWSPLSRFRWPTTSGKISCSQPLRTLGIPSARLKTRVVILLSPENWPQKCLEHTVEMERFYYCRDNPDSVNIFCP